MMKQAYKISGAENNGSFLRFLIIDLLERKKY